MHKYLEIVEIKTKEVVYRINVTDKSERSIDSVESGMNINLNHSDFKTQKIDSKTELKTGDL